MAGAQKSWTPKELRNKTAEKWQGMFYGAGLLSGLISWGSFANNSDSAGSKFALIAIAAFGLGGLIKTTWVKRGQVDVYIKDKKREALRWKSFGAGVVCAMIAAWALNSGAQESGGFFAMVGAGALLIGGLMPIKWVKRAEGAVYR